MVNSEPPRIAAPTTVPPPSPPLTFLTDGAVGLGFVVYLVALAATAAAVAILSYRRTGTASRGNRGEDVVPQPTTAAAVFPHLAPKPPPPPTLFVLLSLRPSDPSSRSLYDDFIFRAVQADPSAAAKKHNFPLGHGRKSAPMYPLSMACCLGASLRTVRALYRAYPDAIAHHDSQNSYAPIHWAVRYSKESQVDPEVLRLLASIYIHSGESGPKHPLRVAIMYGAGPDAIKILADLWAHDRRARARVLHLAVEHSASVEACRALLDAFPDAIAARDQEKCTPLHAALKHGAGEDVVALFIEAAAANLGGNGGEVLRMSDREGNTPLHVACAARAPLGVLQSIVEVDPSLVRLTNNQGKAPLHLLRDALTKKEQQTELSFAEESSLRERIYLLLETSYGEVVAADEECSICHCSLYSSESQTEGLFCGHFFHTDCIKGWLDACILKGTERHCPLCRESTPDRDEGCCICWNPLCCSGMSVVVLSCGHFFHEDCIEEWFKKCIENGTENYCPLCRGSTEGEATGRGV